MSPVIRVSDELYERLGEHASGFEQPSKVIEKILDAYEAASEKENMPKRRRAHSASSGSTIDLLKDSFKSFFKVEPRYFGQKNSYKEGYCDNNNGVQWNVVISKDTGEATLGVNLEGMRYQDWPIATLLTREQTELMLPTLSYIDEADKIKVGLSRDAWQAASRPPIKERYIPGSKTPLSELDEDLWYTMIEEALLCLDEDKGYKGRVIQEVTLMKSGKSVEKEVSPHLAVYTKLWTSPPQSIEEITDLLEIAQKRLLPVYDLVKTQTLT